jgi:hypothetical protein
MLMPETPRAFATELWCAGLPLTARRPLDEAERRVVIAQIARLTRLLGTLALLCVAVAAWPFVLAAIGRGGAFLSFTPAAIAWLASWILCLPALGLLFRDVFRNLSRRLSDLRAGEAMVFAGAIPGEPERSREQQRMVRFGALGAEGGVQQLVVLAGSHAVHVRNARGRDVFVPAWVHEVAPGPAYEFRVPLSREVARIEGQPEMYFERRSLGEPEVAELRAYVRRLRRIERSQAIAALLVGYALWRVSSWVRGQVNPVTGLGDLLSAAAAAITGGLFLRHYLQRLRFSEKLARDVATGWALTLCPGAGAPPENEAAGDAPHAPPVEFLPHSGAVWMDRGRPARWRDLSRAA